MENAQGTTGWFYERNGAQAGPVSQETLLQMAATGEVNQGTRVWCAGMTDWAPLQSLFNVLASPTAAPGRRCEECGQVFPASQILELRGHAVCAGCKPVVLQKMAEGVAATGGGDGVWRSGKKVVFRSGAPMPPVCVKCGAPATTRMPRTLYWHQPWVYVLIVISVLVYIIVAVIVRKSARVEVPLCQEHRSRRTKGVLATWLLFFLMIGLIITAAAQENALFGVGAFAAMVAAIVVGVRSRILTPTFIDERVAHAKGCCEAFLQRLPEYRD